MATWIVGFDPYDPYSETEQGYVIHRKPPEFLAKWGIESEDMAILDDLVYSDAKEPNSIAVYGFDTAVYGFEWADEPPSEEVFRKTMAEAAGAIEEFLLILDSIAEEAAPPE